MEEAWDWDDLDFSFRPTDSMAMATVDEGGTWGPCELQPFGPLQMHPSAGVLNYGQGLFEGMKAYNTDRGRVVMFRPELNARRMQAGADRLGMPPVPEAIFIDAIEQVVDANRHTSPDGARSALCEAAPLRQWGGPRREARTLLHVHGVLHPSGSVLQGRVVCD